MYTVFNRTLLMSCGIEWQRDWCHQLFRTLSTNPRQNTLFVTLVTIVVKICMSVRQWNTSKYISAIIIIIIIIIGVIIIIVIIAIISTTPRVDLITYVSNVRPPTKRFFDFTEIWYVGRGRWVKHEDMQYNPTKGQGQGHEPLKVGNSAIFKGYLLPHL